MFYILAWSVLSGLPTSAAAVPINPTRLASSLSAQEIPVPAPSGSVPMLPLGAAGNRPMAFPPAIQPGPPNAPLAIWVGPADRELRQIHPAGADYYAQPRMAPQVPQFPLNASLGLIFPVASPAPITSGFGWRIHPIGGDRRFHAGTDIGAAQGTPVLAAAAGQVTHAGSRGGYGLAVEIVHGGGSRETLYGHLSQTLVTEGMWVNQGQVIGLVGSSGVATGPHLHFELRQREAEGWAAIDPGGELKQALARLEQGRSDAG